MRKLVIGIDIDDTIEDLLPVWLKYLNKKFHTNVALTDIKDWGLTKHFPNHTRADLLDVLSSKSLWKEVKPKKDAADVLQQLISDGHEIYLITSADHNSIKPKYEIMIKKWFPFISWNQIIITANKHLVNCDVLIDDCPRNLSGGNYKKILFDTLYNRDTDLSDIIRCTNWRDIYPIIYFLSTEE